MSSVAAVFPALRFRPALHHSDVTPLVWGPGAHRWRYAIHQARVLSNRHRVSASALVSISFKASFLGNHRLGGFLSQHTRIVLVVGTGWSSPCHQCCRPGPLVGIRSDSHGLIEVGCKTGGTMMIPLKLLVLRGGRLALALSCIRARPLLKRRRVD